MCRSISVRALLCWYVLHHGNHPELTYRGGQEPIVHLEADLHAVVHWARADARRWAFTLSNASAVYARFRAQLHELGDVNWVAVGARTSAPQM